MIPLSRRFLVSHDDLTTEQQNRLAMIMTDAYADEGLPEFVKERIEKRLVAEGLRDGTNLTGEPAIRVGIIIEEELATFVKEYEF